MCSCKKLKSAFTLVEMLVVIAIIALLAAALIPAIKAALEHGDYARCQARMHNLHQGCMNHLADRDCYPRAGSYELYSALYQTYSEARGWVAWIRKDEKDKNVHHEEDRTKPWAEDKKKSHAKEYFYPHWYGPDAEKSIRLGTLFKYVSEDLTTYVCPRFERKYGKNARRSYAMNLRFGSRRQVNWYACTLNYFKEKEASRMGLFVELDAPSGVSSSKQEGEPGNSVSGDYGENRSVLMDDSAWDWDKKEYYGTAYHRKAGKLYGHIIFVDGHVESLAQGDNVSEHSEKIGEGLH